MTTNQAIAKLSALKQTCRNVGMSIAPKDIEDIQVFLIESEKRIKEIRKENIKLLAKTK